MQALLTKIDDIVRNGNGGIQLRVDRLEQKGNEDNARLNKVVSVLAILISIGGLAYQIIKGL